MMIQLTSLSCDHVFTVEHESFKLLLFIVNGRQSDGGELEVMMVTEW